MKSRISASITSSTKRRLGRSWVSTNRPASTKA